MLQYAHIERGAVQLMFAFADGIIFVVLFVVVPLCFFAELRNLPRMMREARKRKARDAILSKHYSDYSEHWSEAYKDLMWWMIEKQKMQDS